MSYLNSNLHRMGIALTDFNVIELNWMAFITGNPKYKIDSYEIIPLRIAAAFSAFSKL